MTINTDVALRKTLSELCDMRDRAVKMVRHGMNAFDDAESIMREFGAYGIGANARPRDNIDEIIRHIDSDCWRLTFERTGLTRIMDAEAIQKMRDELAKKPPEFTMTNITTQVLTMEQTAQAMFQRGVYNVFRKLPGCYRTNTKEPFRISTKNVMTYVFDQWSMPRLSLRYERSSMINDIDRVMKVLDGKPYHAHELETKINAFFAANRDVNTYEDEYLRVRGFRNGNAHVWFLRDDLLEKINDEIAAYCNGNALAEG